MRLGKRLMAMLLALVLIAGAVPAQVFAANNKAATVTYEKVDAPVAGEKYLIVYNDQVLSYKGSKFSAVKGTVSGNTITVPKGTTEWTADGTGTVYFKHGSDYLSTKVTWNKKDSTPSAADPVVKAQNTQNAYRLFYDHGALHARGQRYSFTTEYHFFLGLNKSGAWTVTNSTKGDLQNANFALYKRVEEVVPPETTEPEPTTKPTDPDPTTPSTDPTNPTDPKPEPEKPALPEGTSYIKTNTVVPGGQFLIVDPDTQKAMTFDGVEQFGSIKGTVEGNVITVSGDEQDYLWTAAVDKDGTKTHFTNTHFTGSTDTQNLKITHTGFLADDSGLKVQPQGKDTKGTRVELADAGNGQFYLKAGSKYLNFDRSWKVGSEPQAFDFYQKVVVVPGQGGTGNQNTEYNPEDVNPNVDIPDYPNPGSVHIDKTAQSKDFKGTGVAQIELNATGIPLHAGADIVLVIDMSQSMAEAANDDDPKGVTKVEATKQAAIDFVNQMMENQLDGTASRNRISFITFNADPKMKNGTTQPSTTKTHHSFVGVEGQADLIATLKKLTASADGKHPGHNGDDITITKDAIYTANGTDYDAAFRLVNEELDKVETNGRRKYVVFMTDGAPTVYNNREARDFMAESEAVYPIKGYEKNTTPYNTCKALQKNYRNEKFAQTVIKADGSVEPHVGKNGNDGAERAKQRADVFAIGFKMEKGSDAFTNIAHKQAIMEQIAIEPRFYVEAKDATRLQQVFNGMAAMIKVGATNAVVTDTISADFDLQMASTITKKDGTEITLDPAPKIEVLSYGIKVDAQGNRVRDEKDVTVTERVTFNPEGTEAYSNLDNPKKNILVDGQIKAHHFTYDVASKTFTWTLGDINARLKAIHYDAYLIGSMQGERGDGIYPTNKEATITYKNFNNKKVTRPYRVPHMPWGAAVVHYEYYLVDKVTGKPVNKAGKSVPFSERVVLYEGFKPINWNNEATIAAGDVKASEFLKDGYTLHQPNDIYHVNAVSSGTGSWTINNKENDVRDGSTRMVYPLQPENGCVDTKVAFGVVNTQKLVEDVVILDYNKPITIDVQKNDLVPGAILHGLIKTLPAGLDASVPSDKVFGEKTLKGDYGTAELTSENVKYSLFDFLDAPEIFYYVTQETTTQANGEIIQYRGQKVTVVPANNVYYEDTFVSGDPTDPNASVAIKYEGNWTVVEEGPNPGGNGGSVEGDPNTDNHGWIPVFGDEMTDSDGVSQKAEFDAQNVAKATFSFTGTGVDIYSRTNNQTGTVAAKIRNADGSIKITKIVDTKSISQGEGQSYYQIPTLTFHEYEDTETGEMKPLPHGEYTVELRVTGAAEGRLVYYLDGIRVYNPIENGHDAYAPDEKNAKFIEVRNVLLDANSFIAGQTDLSGSVFIDQLNDGTDNAPGNPGDTQSVLGVGTYQDLGPKNEVYLKKGQSVAVKVDPAQNNFYQVGLKAPEGKQVTVSLTNGTGKTTKTLSHTADMFYDVAANNGFIIITNTSDSLLSITKLKVTNATTAVNLDTLFQTVTSDEAVAAVYAFSMDPVDPTEPTDPTDPSVPTEPIEPSIPDVDIENPDDEDDEFDDDEFDDDEFDDDEDEDDDEDDEDDEDEDDVDDEDDDEDDEDDEDEDDVDDEDDEDEIDTDSIFSGMKSWF